MIVVNSKSHWIYTLLLLSLQNSLTSSLYYLLAFIGCWWDLRRDSSFSYLCIILVLGVFQGLCRDYHGCITSGWTSMDYVNLRICTDMDVRSQISMDIWMSWHWFPCYNQRDRLYRSEVSCGWVCLFFLGVWVWRRWDAMWCNVVVF
jgi:hypothetical protein